MWGAGRTKKTSIWFERSVKEPVLSLGYVMKRPRGDGEGGAGVLAGQMWAPCEVLSATDGETPLGSMVNIWTGLSVGRREGSAERIGFVFARAM